jgi:hypothetical protein
VVNVLSKVKKLVNRSNRLYRILILLILFSILFDAITTYFGLYDPTVFEFNTLTGFLIKYLGKEIGLFFWVSIVFFSYVILISLFDTYRLKFTEIGFCTIFGLRHMLAGVSNLSIIFNEVQLRIISEKIFTLWPVALIIFILVALTEYTLERK